MKLWVSRPLDGDLGQSVSPIDGGTGQGVHLIPSPGALEPAASWLPESAAVTLGHSRLPHPIGVGVGN